MTTTTSPASLSISGSECINDIAVEALGHAIFFLVVGHSHHVSFVHISQALFHNFAHILPHVVTDEPLGRSP